MTNAPVQSRSQLPAPVFPRGTLASPVTPGLGRERAAMPVHVSTFTPVTGVPVVRPTSAPQSLPKLPVAPTSAPALANVANVTDSNPAIVAMRHAGTSPSALLRSAWWAVRATYGASKPTFREGVIFLSTVAVLFAFATFLLDVGH